MLAAYFGHHKCASTWITDIVQDAAAIAGQPCWYAHSPDSFDTVRLAVKGEGVLVHVNAETTCLTYLPDFRAFHVIRDPRDIAVSAYFSHLYSHPAEEWFLPARRALQGMSKNEGLAYQIEHMDHIYGCMSEWPYGDKLILELRMEDVTQSPEKVFLRAFRFVGLIRGSGTRSMDASYITEDQLRDVLDRHRYAAKSGGRQPGEENIWSHYRKGIPGDWRNHFTEAHKECFKRAFPGLVAQLGYEENDDW